MTVQMEEEVRELVDFSPEGYLVTSFYLNVDATEFPDPDHILHGFDSLIHEAESRRKEVEDQLSHEATESLRDDLAKLRDFFSDGYDRQDTNGVAIFSCSAFDFWHVVGLFKPVTSRVEFGATPFVAPIATFLSHEKPTAILVTDKQNARIFTMGGDDVQEWADIEDFVPHRSSQGGWSQNRYQRRSDNFAKHHIDHAADLTFRLLKRRPFDWLILGTQESYKNEVMDSLHPYLQSRVIGVINVRIDATAAEIVEQARELREEVESRHIDDLLHQIQEFAGAGGRGTIGLQATLQAINEQKVNILVLQEGYQHPGSKCGHCGLLAIEQRDACTACGQPTEPVNDIVAEAVQQCLVLGAAVEVATEDQQLESIQQIGAILYY